MLFERSRLEEKMSRNGFSAVRTKRRAPVVGAEVGDFLPLLTLAYPPTYLVSRPKGIRNSSSLYEDRA